ncbi:MAG: DMT family transporter [Alphaproteobacteria bacterium]|jgi:drug/metabolite transporter (DMT)-like permease|nr:DMT family transporter [Henriciella sp.]MBO6693835.1 DMT family transporter [Henriciella sp.]MCH9750906.1 DMT family transporter [Alphaproteobacteria bacterium]
MTDMGDRSGYEDINKKQLSGNLKGAALMVLSGVGFTVYLLLNKLLSSDVHPVFLAFWRAFLGMWMAIPFVAMIGFSKMKTRRPGLLIVRSLCGTLGFTLAIVAVSDFFTLTLAQFNAISFTRPLFVTLLAALVLREYVGLHRWGALAAGFFGVIVMVMPGVFLFWQPGAFDGAQLDTGSLVALVSAFSLAAAIVLVKFLSAELPSMVLLLYANLLSSVLLAPFVFVFWDQVSLQDWGLIAAMSAFGFVSQFCFIYAMSIGDASFLSPIDYLRLPMSAVADFWVFRLIPGFSVWVGAAIIVVSTLYIGWRERVRGVRKS